MGMASACSTYTLEGTEVYLTGLHCQPCVMIAGFPIGQRRPQDLLLNDSLLFQNTVFLWLSAFCMTLMTLSVDI